MHVWHLKRHCFERNHAYCKIQPEINRCIKLPIIHSKSCNQLHLHRESSPTSSSSLYYKMNRTHKLTEDQIVALFRCCICASELTRCVYMIIDRSVHMTLPGILLPVFNELHLLSWGRYDYDGNIDMVENVTAHTAHERTTNQIQTT